MSESTNLYDRNFIGWLERRIRARSAGAQRDASLAPQRYSRIDVNQLLRGTLDKRELSRLDGLSFAR